LGQKLANTCSIVAGRIIVQQEKNLDSRTHQGETAECASGGDPLLLYKILHLLFFPLVRILCALRLESPKKIINMVLMRGPLEFQFLRPSGCLTNPFRTLSLCFGVMGKTPGLISRNNFVKKFLYASAVAISCQDVTRSSLCSRIKQCGTKHAHYIFFPKILFQNPKNYSLGDIQRFCNHS
jgi:hypothetical protein